MGRTRAGDIHDSLQVPVEEISGMDFRRMYDRLIIKLPSFVVRNSVLNDMLMAIGEAIDKFIRDLVQLKSSLTISGGDPVMLDALAADYGLKRHPEDNDKILAVRIHNAIQTHQRRGTMPGLINEGGERALVTPYVVTMQMALGVNPIGVGWGLGGVDAGWIHLWNDSAETEAIVETHLKSIVPFNYKDGIDYIPVYGVSDGFKSVRGSELSDAGSYSITNDGFYFSQNSLIPGASVCTYSLGNMDLGASYATYKWLADWIDYAHWDLSYGVVVSVRFSSDEVAWSAWTPYGKNQFIPDSEIERYAQFKIELTIDPGYDSLEHYIFKRFILKGLTETQWLYGEEPRGVAFHEPEFGN